MQSKLDDSWKSEGYKTFSQNKYNSFVPLEKQVMDKLNIKDCKIEKNIDKYGIDLLILKNNKIIGGIEVESHEKYWDDVFPFKTVHFLGRKKKFKNKFNFYLMTSKELKDCVLVDFEKLDDKYIKIQNNDDCKNEPIYDIPNNMCIFGWNNVNNYLENSV